VSDYSRAAPAQRERESHFHHGAPYVRPDGPLGPVTRYLCGAAYLDETFPNRVIDELIADPQRAVVPAQGFDIDPVVRHCFRARRIWFLQNLWVCGVLLVSAFAAGWATAFVLGLAFVLSVPTWSAVRSRWPTWKVVAAVLVGLTVLSCLLGPLALLIDTVRSLGRAGLTTTDVTGPTPGSAVARFLLTAFVITALILAGLVCARFTMVKTLAIDLAPRNRQAPPGVPPGPVAARVAAVATAQHGNVVMHSQFEPFLGAGEVVDDWSVAIEIKPDQSARHLTFSNPARPAVPEVDALDLCRHVKRRVAALRALDLPERERVAGLTVRDQIMAGGTHWRDFELIDGYRRPYAFASKEAVEAIIRHPQASARHVLRVVVNADGTDVESEGRALLAAVSQRIVVSTFMHIAVEGNMLYIEHTSTVLGPLRSRIYEIDRYLPRTDGLIWDAFLDALRRFGRTTLVAPWHLVRSIVGQVRLYTGPSQSDARALDMAHDFGARADVREMVSAPVFHNFLQRLDAEKYTKLVNRRIFKAVVEYLDEQGIDTSEYSARVSFVQDNSTRITNSTIGGSVTGGMDNVSPRGSARAATGSGVASKGTA
jgi:hypothetical protein